MRNAAGPKFAVLLALLGVPLLSACGGTVQAGAAATLGGDRITVEEVQSRAADVRDAQRAAPNGEELVKQTGTLMRQTLYFMVLTRVVDRAAEDEGIKVTDDDVDVYRKQYEQQAGGPEALKQMMLTQAAMTPDQMDAWLRLQTQGIKLTEASGAAPGSPEAEAAVNDALVKASKELDIEVNPRFGAWDAEMGNFKDTKFKWIKQVTVDREAQQSAVPLQ
ncbi:hypothetical protein SRB5_64140 [Streptomyces sp. RB5]|uniref:Lipoprotein n=1 Tax=Streptomyces smaragdinus TaxID=2585196 RepID=A0A7K0CRV4_9ACTN|nr:SurA N-terminal domain-containing protein [Streptomyces smaragdinus]MQY16217.1 hypothetical protein [Streptomyces smaragdinus]